MVEVIDKTNVRRTALLLVLGEKIPESMNVLIVRDRGYRGGKLIPPRKIEKYLEEGWRVIVCDYDWSLKLREYGALVREQNFNYLATENPTDPITEKFLPLAIIYALGFGDADMPSQEP